MMENGNYKMKKDKTRTDNMFVKYSVMNQDERKQMIVPPKYAN
jgi:hypothetical protein